MIYLKYSRPGTEETDLASNADLVTIGTWPENVVHITGDGIQIYHAQIDAKTQCITELDAPTPAGLKINGVKTTSATLENGDIIAIGPWTLLFYHTGEEYVSERDTRTLKVESLHSHGTAKQ